MSVNNMEILKPRNSAGLEDFRVTIEGELRGRAYPFYFISSPHLLPYGIKNTRNKYYESM